MMPSAKGHVKSGPRCPPRHAPEGKDRASSGTSSSPWTMPLQSTTRCASSSRKAPRRACGAWPKSSRRRGCRRACTPAGAHTTGHPRSRRQGRSHPPHPARARHAPARRGDDSGLLSASARAVRAHIRHPLLPKAPRTRRPSGNPEARPSGGLAPRAQTAPACSRSGHEYTVRDAEFQRGGRRHDDAENPSPDVEAARSRRLDRARRGGGHPDRRRHASPDVRRHPPPRRPARERPPRPRDRLRGPGRDLHVERAGGTWSSTTRSRRSAPCCIP